VDIYTDPPTDPVDPKKIAAGRKRRQQWVDTIKELRRKNMGEDIGHRD